MYQVLLSQAHAINTQYSVQYAKMDNNLCILFWLTSSTQWLTW